MRIDPRDIRDRVTLSAVPSPTGGSQAGAPPSSFGEVLKEALQHVDGLQKEANQEIQHLSVDGSTNIHQVMIATEKADLSFRLMMQVRNKIVDAYQEVMRMQV